MAEWQSKQLKRTGGADGEGLEARIERERQERWEASDEFQAEVAKQQATSANIDLASATQVTHDDIAQEKLSEQEGKAMLLRRWIADVTGRELPVESEDLRAELKSGVVLCTLLNSISPGTVPNIQKSSKPFPQRENIKAFTEGARAFGVPEHENFETNDLFEASNMKQVLICLLSLGRRSGAVPGYDGPTLKSNTGKGTRAAKSSGKVRQLSTNLKELIPMDNTPATRAEVGSEEWIKQQLKAEKEEKQAAAIKAAESAKPLSYNDMRPFQLKKLLKQAGLPDSGTKVELVARLEERDRVEDEAKSVAQKALPDEPEVQKLSAHAGARRAKRGTKRKPPSRIRARIPEGTPAKVKQIHEKKPMTVSVTETSDETVEDAAVHIHVGGLNTKDAEDEQKLCDKFSKFGTVLAVTLRRRRMTQPNGSQKVSWALIAFANADAAMKAVQGFSELRLGPDVICKPLDIVQAASSKGEMAYVVRQHQSRTRDRKGGVRELYRCVRKALVRKEAAKSSDSIGDIFPGDMLEELFEMDVDGIRRLNFETIWATRGPDLGLSGWISVVSNSSEVILETLSVDEKEMWLLGTKPTLLRRSIAMYKSLAEQSLVYEHGSGGGVYTCVKVGVIRARKERESEQVGQLAIGSVVPVSASATLPSGLERVRFESVWNASGPHLGKAGWSSIVAANGGVVLEPMPEAAARSWRVESLKLLAATLGRQGIEAAVEARRMSDEEQELLLNADGATLSRVAEDTYARAKQRWRKGLSKLSMLRAFGATGAGGTGNEAGVEAQKPLQGTDIHASVLDALRQEAGQQDHASPQSNLIRTDLQGPATFSAMASAVADCAAVPGQTNSTAEMLRKLAASLAQLDAASKAADVTVLGDEV